MTAALVTLRKRKIPVCYCPSCVAYFPERAKELAQAKRMLHGNVTLRFRATKPKQHEAP